MIPWAQPELFGKERQYVLEALDSTWISEGSFVKQLELRFQELYKTPYISAVTNGTAAIHLALLACDIKPGDEVIVPAYGFLAAVNILKIMNIDIIFCDIDLKTWSLDNCLLEKLINSNTKAIITIHNYGNVAGLSELKKISKKHGLYLIEDCAEAFPCYYAGHLAGSFGDIATFSFQSTKNVTSGEGGLVRCGSKNLFEKVELIKSHGMDRKVQYWHLMPGLNYRLTNVQAAIATAQLEQIELIKRKKDHIYKFYKEKLSKFNGIIFQDIEDCCVPTIWATAIRLKKIKNKSQSVEVVSLMKEAGIECRIGFWEASKMSYLNYPTCKNAKVISKQTIVLPISTKLTDKDLEYITSNLLKILRKKSLIDVN